MVKRHVQQVSVLLEGFEARFEEVTDQELREVGDILLKIAERCADRRHGELLDADQLDGVNIKEREPLRLALGALLALLMSGASIALLKLFGLSDGLEPVAIGASVVVSAAIVFGGNALQKLESIASPGNNPGRTR
ncbi:hypothetical protein L7D48_11300 [Streptomyces sp. S1A]|uniref:hypothetical protein n=1 Tax=Streptomyces sp. ICN903 TaxID=2964654 RepID=UPI001EDAFCDE|nr:hypothetical protein [Streptomyces sp. ICN903]MCG3041138.1 hypothetical protein [Streptomyces sp. ICN903]